MSAAFLAVLSATIAVATIAASLGRRVDLLGYPALASFVILGWALPQAVALVGDRDLPDGALALLLLMVVLSQLAIAAAWAFPATAPRFTLQPLSRRRLLHATAALTAVGALFAVLLRRLPSDVLGETQWSGIAVAYLFLAHAQFFALALATNLALRRPDWTAIFLALVNLAFFFDAILIFARRGIAAGVALAVLCSLAFVRGWAPPRTLMLGAAVVGTLLVHSIGEIRGVGFTRGDDGLSVNAERSLADYLAIDFVGNLPFLHPENAHEIRNAAILVAAAEERFRFDLGRAHWNALVFRLVPAQLVGSGVKAALMFDTKDLAAEVYDHRGPVGSTITGFADAFSAFWLLGALVFFAIARLLRCLFVAARSGALVAQYLYAVLVTDALLALTHLSSHFPVALAIAAAFSMPVFFYARPAAEQVAATRSFPA